MKDGIDAVRRFAKSLEIGRALVKIVERSETAAAAINAFSLVLLFALLAIAFIGVFVVAGAQAFQTAVLGVAVFVVVSLSCLLLVVREERHFLERRVQQPPARRVSAPKARAQSTGQQRRGVKK